MKKRNKRIFWVVVVLVLVSVSTLSVLGYKKSHNNKDKDENNIVKDNVKIITEESDKQPILVEDDKITFDSNPRSKKEMSLFQELQVQHQMVLYEMLLEYRKQKENTLYKQNLLY